jgi:GntR family transcriptional regulator / MocR family aminotransferase
MKSGAFDRHLRKATAELRRRRVTLFDGIERHCAHHMTVRDSHAGMHVVGWLTQWTVERVARLVEHAKARGLGLHPVHPHYSLDPRPAGLLLGYASLSPQQLRSATKLLGECLQGTATDAEPMRRAS